MKAILTLIAVSCLFLLPACRGGEGRGGADSVDTLSLVMQVRDCARLYTAEFEVDKLVLKDDPLHVRGQVFQKPFDVKVPMGERKAMIPIQVTLKAYIDFSAFNEKNVLRSDGRIVILLPDPRVVVTASRIDHEEVKQFVSLTRSDLHRPNWPPSRAKGKKRYWLQCQSWASWRWRARMRPTCWCRCW